MVRRIYVEKKPAFAVEAAGLLEDLRENLNLQNLTQVRVVNRYDVEGIQDETLTMAIYTVFAEPAIDMAWENDLTVPQGSFSFVAAYVPGQYDQRGDSAEQCIRLMNPSAQVVVKSAKVYILSGNLTPEEVDKVKAYVINPVDSREESNDIPDTLDMQVEEPQDVATVEGFCALNDEDLEAYRQEKAFAMSPADLRHIRQYFAEEEKRNPTDTELKVIDTYWSDHCRHTTFNTALEEIGFEDSAYGRLVEEAFHQYLQMREELNVGKNKDICLMDMACIGTKYLKKKGKAQDLDESGEINAFSIKVKAMINGQPEDWLVMFKNETHNHLTEIEPFGGAATCLGGCIRDPLSGRVYVYQAMRVTGAGDPRVPVSETLPGKLPQKKLTQQAAHGYSSYGNQIGLATGLVSEVYHPDYVAKRMEVGAVIGAAPADHVRREVPAPGDVVILVGGRTGRDGVGGATGSSKEHTTTSIETCSVEVQKGNPPVERNLQRLFRRKDAALLIKRCNDFGAGGVSVAIGELAESLDINLDLIPKKYEGLDGTELAISESQERMAVVVEKKDQEAFIRLAAEENLEATTVALVTDTGRVRMAWRGKTILDLSRAFLDTNGARQVGKAYVAAAPQERIKALEDYEKAVDYLTDLNCCSQKGLVERFDSTIGVGTVLMPLGGERQLSPAMGMAALLPVTQGETTTATLMTYGYDPQLACASPYHGAVYAVLDCATKMAALGGDITSIRLSFQEYFEKLTGEMSWGKPLAALLGGLTAQKALEIPAIGGKDSMSGTFLDIQVPPALISFGVTAIDANLVISTEFKKTDSHVVFIPCNKDANHMPNFPAFRANMARVRQLAEAKDILAAAAVGYGGVFMAAVKMAVGNDIGCTLGNIDSKALKGRGYGGLLLEISGEKDPAQLLEGVEYILVGKTNKEGYLQIDVEGEEETLWLDDVRALWTKPLESVFPVRTKDAEDVEEAPAKPAPAAQPKLVHGSLHLSRPKVLIPAFPGTNCELDTKRAFEKAGGDAEIFLIRNMSQSALVESIQAITKKIQQAQIIALPGGFSGGDEPDGSAKFINAFFRNPEVEEAVNNLLEKQDGLMLGICNGFQALMKLGLLPTGRISPVKEDSPTLTFNKIGRHQSRLVRTRVASKMSPWLAGAKQNGIYTIPISHGEGRFICNQDVLNKLIENGQIATQYTDVAGIPAMDIASNPNHSVMAIEGITSPDGRVFGRMGHAERIGGLLYKNVEGQQDMQIFESGVNYFR